MKKKSTRNSRKGSPLSIDLRDFLMYTSPSRFAPKLRENGGEAFPQAPTMDQFFSYGAPTPQTPFVFQDGGSNDFSGDNVDKRSNFLNKIKEAAYRKFQEELENEAMGYEEEANMMFQSGGPFQMDFSKANAWANSIQPSNLQESASNFAALWDAAQSAPTDTYIKRWKNIPVPKAQEGLNFNDIFSNQANLPFDYSGDYVAGSDPFVGMTRDERLAYEREKRGTNSDPRFMLPPATANDQVIADQRARAMGVDPLTGKMIPKDMTPIMERETNDVRNMTPPQEQRDSSSLQLMEPPRGASLVRAASGPNSGAGKGIVQSAVDELIYGTDGYDEDEKKTDSKDGVVVKNPDGTESTLSPEEVAKRKAEEDKKKAGDVPAAGSAEESKQAAAAGMTLGEYRTFLTRATPNMRRALLPGNRLKSMDFYFDTYGPSGQLLQNSWNQNPITASNTQQAGNAQSGNNASNASNTASNQSNPRGGNRGNGNFLANLFARKGNYRGPQDNVSPADLAAQERALGEKSQYDPRGYNNEYSDFRNQVFQNRRNRLGERIDRLYANADQMNQLYGQEPSQGYFDKLRKLENRYDRIGEGRTPDRAPLYNDMISKLTDPQRRKQQPFNFGSNYARPQFERNGGMLKMFQGDEGSSQVNDPYGMSSYSADGYDTTEREDYAGNTIYEQAPTMDINQNDGDMTKVGSSGMRAIFGNYNAYEAPMMLAGLQGIAGFMDRRDQFKRRNEYRDKTGADQVYAKTWDNDKGDYEMNSGRFRPNREVPVQFSGYNNQSFTAKMGGSYKKGGEYYLSEEEIQRIIDMGGEVEFLED
jgi:hypothetical protein